MGRDDHTDGAYYGRTAPDGPWDVIVIGSGMGGMTCAAMLSVFGLRVLVLEQHSVPGGMTHVFRRKGYTWDVGVHAVGEVTPDSRVGVLLDQLCGGRLEWTSLGPVSDEFHYPGEIRIDMADDPARFVDNLVRHFPAERDAIQRYMDTITAVGASMQELLLTRAFGVGRDGRANPTLGLPLEDWMRRTTGEVLRDLVSDPRLRTVLASQWGYYGADPRDSTFAVHALVVNHFAQGGYYPRGGSASIAGGLLRTVAEAGGWTRVRADVEGLLRDGDRVCGVVLQGGEELRAPRVVSGIGALNTVATLLTDEERQAEWARSIGALEPSPAHLCLYLGFEGDIRRAGASAANRWLFSTWDVEPDLWHLDEIPDPIPILYTSFPSLKDPDHDPGEHQRHTGEVVTFVPYEDFLRWEQTRWRHRGEEYEALKRDLSERMLRQLLQWMPGLEPMVRYHELSTPLSTTHFTRATDGAIYGIKPTPARFTNPWLRPQTPVEGLYLTGSDMANVGVMGALLGGVMTASKMEPIKAIRFVKSML